MTSDVSRSELERLAPAGHYIAVRIGFAFPIYEENCLPRDWIELYTTDGLMLRDPVTNWMYRNTGAQRWSALAANDPHHVLVMARQYGLTYGAVVCCMDPGSGERSYGSFARADREFSDGELVTLLDLITLMHNARKRPSSLTPAETEALRFVRDGLRFKQIAYELGVSESAVKARLTNAKKKLGAKTSVQAVSIALDFGML